MVLTARSIGNHGRAAAARRGDRRRRLLAILALPAFVAVALVTVSPLRAAATLSPGCLAVNDASSQGAYGVKTLASLEFYAGETITITSSGPTSSPSGFDPFTQVRFDSSQVASADFPGTMTYEFPTNQTGVVDWFIESEGTVGTYFVTWTATCTGPDVDLCDPGGAVPPGYRLITGTSRDDIIFVWMGGNHVVRGLGGNDRIYGGSGNDIVAGGEGNDSVAGGAGTDCVDGGPGDDAVSGGSGRDTVSGGAGNDKISADSGNDTASGGSGNDDLRGGTGDDFLSGGAGFDRIWGDPGTDTGDDDASTPMVSVENRPQPG